MSADYINALLRGFSWNGFGGPIYGQPAVISYSFLNFIPDYYANITTFTPTNFDVFNGTQQGAALAAFSAWAAVANLTFTPVVRFRVNGHLEPVMDLYFEGRYGK